MIYICSTDNDTVHDEAVNYFVDEYGKIWYNDDDEELIHFVYSSLNMDDNDTSRYAVIKVSGVYLPPPEKRIYVGTNAKNYIANEVLKRILDSI